MSKSIKTIVEGKLLSWARNITKTPVEVAAKAVGVTPEKLILWETDKDKPTVRQLHLLAKKYRLPFAIFYLSDPPDFHIPRVRDFRSIEEIKSPLDEYILNSEIRSAWEKREIVLEYQEEIEEESHLLYSISVDDNTSTVADNLREFLGLTIELQKKWKDNRSAFNGLRNLVEDKDILVLQTSQIDLLLMRGFSLNYSPLPVVVANRKDAYAGRSFTILHELVHLLLRTSAICNIVTEGIHDLESKKMEIFCNSVAAQSLVPNQELLNHPVVSNHKALPWENLEIMELARTYNTSREVIVRRLLELGLASKDFYEEKRAEFQKEFEQWRTQKGGPVKPAVNANSLLGRRFVTTLLTALDQGRITPNDLSDFIGIKIKHFDELRAIA